MSKLENLRHMAGSNAAESMGTVPAPPMPGESALAAPRCPRVSRVCIRSKRRPTSRWPRSSPIGTSRGRASMRNRSAGWRSR